MRVEYTTASGPVPLARLIIDLRTSSLDGDRCLRPCIVDDDDDDDDDDGNAFCPLFTLSNANYVVTCS